MDEIIGSLATIPERHDYYLEVADKIKPQVDQFHVYQGRNRWGDANKFRGVIGKEGYLFTFDDDLIYPENYVEYLIEKIEEYNRKAVITLHGKRLNDPPIESFYSKEAYERLNCLMTVTPDQECDIVGTGVLAWHSDLFQPTMAMFGAKNMADIWVSKYLEKHGIKRVVATHFKGFLKKMETEDRNSLWTLNREREQYLTGQVNDTVWDTIR